MIFSRITSNSPLVIAIFTVATFSSATCYGLVNGHQLKGVPDLIRMRFDNGWICSGAYIDDHTILTAAHCIAGDKNEKIQIAKIESEEDEQLSVAVVEMIPNPSYESQLWPSYDVGIIKTTKNSKFAGNFKITKNSAPLWNQSILFGTGRTDPSSQGVSRTSGTNDFLKIGSVIFFLSSSKNNRGSTGLNASIAPNDSGAPVTNDKFEILGVATTTTAKESLDMGLPILSTATSITDSDNYNFVYAHLGPASDKKTRRR